MADLPGINDDRGQTIQGISSASINQRIPTSIAVNPSTKAMLVEATLTSTTITGTVAVTQSTAPWDTELPAAVALSDGQSNPTAPAVGSFLMGYEQFGESWYRIEASGTGDNADAGVVGVWSNARLFGFDGATWDRIRGNSVDGLLVNLGANNDVSVTNATAANLKVAATLDAETTKVIGTVRVLGNAGAAVDAAPGAVPPANGIYLVGKDGFSNVVHAYGIQEGQGDGGDGKSFFPTAPWFYNGSTYDRTRGDTTAGQWTNIKGGLMPAGTALTTYAARITSNTTTTPISSTAYISSIIIVTEVAGTGSTIVVKDKQGTPQVLINGLVTTALTTTPSPINFQTPIKMTSGIDIVTAGVGAATVDIWINYYA